MDDCPLGFPCVKNDSISPEKLQEIDLVKEIMRVLLFDNQKQDIPIRLCSTKGHGIASVRSGTKRRYNDLAQSLSLFCQSFFVLIINARYLANFSLDCK